MFAYVPCLYQGHQICGDELTFRMGLFISVMKAEREGGRDADAAVRPCIFPSTCFIL